MEGVDTDPRLALARPPPILRPARSGLRLGARPRGESGSGLLRNSFRRAICNCRRQRCGDKHACTRRHFQRVEAEGATCVLSLDVPIGAGKETPPPIDRCRRIKARPHDAAIRRQARDDRFIC